MTDFTVRSDSVNVDQIMEQIRARIREKRGADYTEQEIRELAAVKLERFLDPKGVRSDLLEQFRKRQQPAPPNYAFEDTTLFDSHRAPLRWIRKLLRPVLKLFFNPNPLIQALHIQSKVNNFHAERMALDQLYFEILHNSVLETTRLAIELKNLKMRVESLTSRLEFNERRARALESVVVYKPAATDIVAEEEEPAVQPAAEGAPAQAESLGPGQRSRRRRRRRGRRGGTPASVVMGGADGSEAAAGDSVEERSSAREAASGSESGPSEHTGAADAGGPGADSGDSQAANDPDRES